MDLTDEIARLMAAPTPKEEPEPIMQEASYAASVRAYRERERLEILEERRLFHQRMLTTHRQNFREIIRRHKRALAECEQELGVTDINNAKGAA